jgi:hypothetical protein
MIPGPQATLSGDRLREATDLKRIGFNLITVLVLCVLFHIPPAALHAQTNPYHAPLYWSVYEHHILKEEPGVEDNYISEADLLANIDWVEANLKDFGYDMICMDGWGDVSSVNENGYRVSHSIHWDHDYAWWAGELQARGMNLGMYDNPLWIHMNAVDSGATIVGTDIPVGSLVDYDEDALWFTWVQVDRPGAEEYVKGCIQHYADMGIKYLRVDFLSWFETGYDRNLGTVGPARPTEYYETALRWMREACDSNGMFLSLVMPNMFNEAEIERQYGHMTRIDEDCGSGGWWRFSDNDRGHRYPTWSQYANACDGYTYWSHIAGRGGIILDGDFIRLNTFDTDTEKRTVISAHLMAGGPLSVADQYNTIGDDIWLYQNEEMLALNSDGFVGAPLTNDPTDEASQIWTGQMTSGEWIAGFFNRETDVRTRSLNLTDLGFIGGATVRDLWQHADLGFMSSVSADIPPHGCLIMKFTDAPCGCTEQSIAFDAIEDKHYGDADFVPSASASSDLPVQFEIALGPATVEEGMVHLTGQNGRVFVVASQPGDSDFCAAFPKVRSFEVTGGHQAAMYVAGTFTGWSPNIRMTLVDDTWVAEDVEITAGHHEMKFANTNDWSGDDWGNATGLAGTAQLATGGGPNISFTMPQTGSYDIHFNDITLAYSVGCGQTGIDEVGPNGQSREIGPDECHPNPFGQVTEISYELARPTQITLSIYDVSGRVMRRLILSEMQGPGTHVVPWNGTDDAGQAVGSGIYFYRLETSDRILTRKLVLVQ